MKRSDPHVARDAPTMLCSRDFISPAALFVNVTARMRSGATRISPSR